jgi:hypothetical protein
VKIFGTITHDELEKFMTQILVVSWSVQEIGVVLTSFVSALV